MIYTAALTLLLASAANAKNAPTISAQSALLKMSNIKQLHAATIASLTKEVSEAPRAAKTIDANTRALFANPNFLNYRYSSDETCSEAPYAHTGIGMGGCIPTDGGGSYRLACTSGVGIDILYMLFTSNDCSGTAADMSTAYYAADCRNVIDPEMYDDPTVFDDKFGFIEYSGSFQLSCDVERLPTNTYIDISAFNDDTCDLVTGYYGLNLDSCIPFEPDYGFYLKLTDPSCDNIAYSDSTCSTLFPLTDDDNDGDDYDDADDDYDDDDAVFDGTCLAADDDSLDDSVNPGQFVAYSAASCSAGDDDEEGNGHGHGHKSKKGPGHKLHKRLHKKHHRGPHEEASSGEEELTGGAPVLGGAGLAGTKESNFIVAIVAIGGVVAAGVTYFTKKHFAEKAKFSALATESESNL
jgi:hypothetical protein